MTDSTRVYNLEHGCDFFSTMSSSSDIFIPADSRAGIASLSYISRKNSARKVHSHKVVDLPVFLTNGSKYSEHILIRENAPFCFDKQTIYPRGVSYTSSAYSLAFAFENVPPELASDHCVEIGENLFPIGGNELFGHFLLQLVPKLIIAKKAELFKSHIFIFDDRTPARFFQILRAFDLLPTRYMSMPQNMLVTSNKSIVLSSSPVQNLVSTLSRQVQCHRDFVQAIPDSLRQYLPAIPLYGLDFRLYREMSSLPIGHVDSSRLRALPSSGGKFFLTLRNRGIASWLILKKLLNCLREWVLPLLRWTLCQYLSKSLSLMKPAL